MSLFNLFKLDDQVKISEFFRAGEYLFKNGTPSYGAFFVCSGKIELIYQSDDGFFIKEIKNAGDIIGEDNLDVHYYVFDAVALEDCEVYFYDKNFFLEELNQEEGGGVL